MPVLFLKGLISRKQNLFTKENKSMTTSSLDDWMVSSKTSTLMCQEMICWGQWLFMPMSLRLQHTTTSASNKWSCLFVDGN